MFCSTWSKINIRRSKKYFYAGFSRNHSLAVSHVSILCNCLFRNVWKFDNVLYLATFFPAFQCSPIFLQFIQSSQNIRNDSISKNGKILATPHATFSEPHERETHKVLKIESSHVSSLWFSHRTVKNRIVQNYCLCISFFFKEVLWPHSLNDSFIPLPLLCYLPPSESPTFHGISNGKCQPLKSTVSQSLDTYSHNQNESFIGGNFISFAKLRIYGGCVGRGLDCSCGQPRKWSWW